MTIVVTCDGCGTRETPRREDICEVTFNVGSEVTIIRDYCAKCENARVTEIKKFLGEE